MTQPELDRLFAHASDRAVWFVNMTRAQHWPKYRDERDEFVREALTWPPAVVAFFCYKVAALGQNWADIDKALIRVANWMANGMEIEPHS